MATSGSGWDQRLRRPRQVRRVGQMKGMPKNEAMQAYVDLRQSGGRSSTARGCIHGGNTISLK